MWRLRRNRVCGVLNDFDLSSFRDSTKPSSQQRTGTRPYMARELQKFNVVPPKHLYRHDLESFFYALIILAGTHVLLDKPNIDSITQEKQYLQIDRQSEYCTWLYADEISLHSQKIDLMSSDTPIYSHESFYYLEPRVQELKDYLRLGDGEKNAHLSHLSLAQRHPPKNPNRPPRIPTFDDETLGGHWSYENFLEVLDMPFEVMYPVPLQDITPSLT